MKGIIALILLFGLSNVQAIELRTQEDVCKYASQSYNSAMNKAKRLDREEIFDDAVDEINEIFESFGISDMDWYTRSYDKGTELDVRNKAGAMTMKIVVGVDYKRCMARPVIRY